ncbi:hypothetical protein HPP92_008792 [Vanilla planifolia]|uniref:Uncharacterized protein n=1 Tax=Vanilla planifolia TaxID=51239 RepID=A0A835V603_VANPL|nr:hypothetical protein HPP92_008792 [Vanilla planifolia]
MACVGWKTAAWGCNGLRPRPTWLRSKCCTVVHSILTCTYASSSARKSAEANPQDRTTPQQRILFCDVTKGETAGFHLPCKERAEE